MKNLGFILAIVSLTFLPCLGNQFVNWDDTEIILNNPLLRNLSFSGIKDMFTHYTMGNYHPLTNLSLAVEYHWAGCNPFLIHLDNLILHVLNTALVYALVMVLVRQRKTAWITAFLFGIHPLHVESVAWATERKDVLYAFFYLSALIFYQKRLRGAALVFFIFSLLSKIQALTLPLAFFAIDYYQGRKFIKEIIFEKFPFLVLSVVFGLIGLYGGKITGAYHMSDSFDWGDRIFLASSGTILYLVKLIVPFQLSCLYPYPSKSVLFVAGGAFCLALILSSGSLLWRFRQNRLLMLGVFFFIINIFLGLQLVTVGKAYMADRFTYIASIGVFILEASLISGVLEDRWPIVSRRKSILVIGLVAYLFVLALVSFTRCQVWQNGGRLWSDVINQYPDNYEAYLYRAGFYRDTGDFDKAFRDYAASIAAKPDFAKAYVNRGLLYQALRRYNLAMADLNKAVEIRPEDCKILINRANTFGLMGNFDAALDDFNHILSIDPKNALAYYNRGILFEQKGDQERAREDFKRSKSLQKQ